MDATAGVIVRAGDSLWSIAAAQLSDDATARQIDATWRAWYRANRDVIGPNPNLVIPGQILQAPQPTDAPSVTR
jgi:nucleoid-associated protein YgaU